MEGPGVPDVVGLGVFARGVAGPGVDCREIEGLEILLGVPEDARRRRDSSGVGVFVVAGARDQPKSDATMAFSEGSSSSILEGAWIWSTSMAFSSPTRWMSGVGAAVVSTARMVLWSEANWFGVSGCRMETPSMAESSATAFALTSLAVAVGDLSGMQ